jgi:hypothetical protein
MGQADVGLVVELQGVGSGGGQVREDRVGIAADMQRVGAAEAVGQRRGALLGKAGRRLSQMRPRGRLPDYCTETINDRD